MSLIIAYNTYEQLRIFSDSKVSLINSTGRASSLNNGVIKAIIIDNSLCFCYAGSVSIAENAFKQVVTLWAHNKDINNIKRTLLDIHQSSNKKVEFIIGYRSDERKIVQIKNGVIQDRFPISWIGDYDAFNEYQKNYHLITKTQDAELKYGNLALMMNAFHKLLSEKKINTVNEPSIEVISDKKRFYYAPGAIVYSSPQPMPSKQWEPIKFGTVAQGAFGYSILTPKENGIGAVGVQFYSANIGFLYYPTSTLSFEPIVYKNVSIEDFVSQVQKEYQVEFAKGGFL